MALLEASIPIEVWTRKTSQNGFGENPASETDDNEAAWASTLHSIRLLGSLEENWDGQGAAAPAKDLLASAIGLAHLFAGRGLSPPDRVVPGIEGTVILEWQMPDGAYREVEIDKPFHAEVMVVAPGQEPQHGTLPTE
jgi:hypothetical protein